MRIVRKKRYQRLLAYEKYHDLNEADKINANPLCDMCFTGMTNDQISPDELKNAFCAIKFYGKRINLCVDHLFFLRDELNRIIGSNISV